MGLKGKSCTNEGQVCAWKGVSQFIKYYLNTTNLLSRYSLLPALCSDGIIYSRIREGAYDGAAFLGYVKALMPRMNRWPAARSVLVLDNCSIHHLTEVEEVCEERYVL